MLANRKQFCNLRAKPIAWETFQNDKCFINWTWGYIQVTMEKAGAGYEVYQHQQGGGGEEEVHEAGCEACRCSWGDCQCRRGWGEEDNPPQRSTLNSSNSSCSQSSHKEISMWLWWSEKVAVVGETWQLFKTFGLFWQNNVNIWQKDTFKEFSYRGFIFSGPLHTILMQKEVKEMFPKFLLFKFYIFVIKLIELQLAEGGTSTKLSSHNLYYFLIFLPPL